MQIAYRIAREQFKDRLNETFLVLTDDQPKAGPSLEARGLSLEDPRRDRRRRRESDTMSVESGTIAKKPDQTRSAEKQK